MLTVKMSIRLVPIQTTVHRDGVPITILRTAEEVNREVTEYEANGWVVSQVMPTFFLVTRPLEAAVGALTLPSRGNRNA